MFGNLQERLERAIHTLKGDGRITEINVASTVKEIRKALIDADVNYKIAKEFTDKVKEKAMGEKVLTAVSPSQLLTKIVQDELTLLMGSASVDINLKNNPSVILIAGLQGSGKTTFSAKLANYIKSKRNRSVLLVAADVYRPAAMEQLRVLGGQIGAEVFIEIDNKNPVAIAQNALKYAKDRGFQTVIIDTAGRIAIDEEMMAEIKLLKTTLQPDESLFVVDSMTGQDAVNTAKAFNDAIDFDGVVLTKLDGDTRGGAAISIRSVVNKPIKFVSTGEKVDTLDIFYPDRMAQRILGMGDIVSLVEKAQEQYDEKEAAKLNAKLRKNQFDFDDFLSQLNQIKKMGNLKDLMAMIPGVGKAIKDIDISDDSFKKIEAMILSMTAAERQNPEIIDGNRRKRLAGGSGNTIQEVNQFMKQFEEMRKMIKNMNKLQSAGKMMRGLPFGKK
jgi:signal recognition particle subunit SRP54